LDGARVATATHKAIPAYIAAVDRAGHGLEGREPLSPVQAAEERLLMGLRIDEGVPLAQLSPLPLTALPDLARAGVVRADALRLYATPAGRLVLDRVIAELAT
jgi:oxygen-independent coproporphyrinogen-3 oxidase